MQTYYSNAFYRELREETERPKLQKWFVGLAGVTDREYTGIQRWAISPEIKGKRILKRLFPLALSRRGTEFLQEFARSSPDAKRIQVKGMRAIPFL